MHLFVKNDIIEGNFQEKLSHGEVWNVLERMKRTLEKKGAKINFHRSTLESDPKEFKTFFSVIVEGMDKDIELFLSTPCPYGTWYRTPGNPDFFADQQYRFYLQADETVPATKTDKKKEKKKFGFGPPLEMERAEIEKALVDTFGAQNLGGFNYKKGWTTVTFIMVGKAARDAAANTGRIEVTSGGTKSSLRVREDKENANKLVAGHVLVEALTPIGFPEGRLMDLFKDEAKGPSHTRRLEPTKEGWRFELAFHSNELAEELISTPERTIGNKLIKLRYLSKKDEAKPKAVVLRSLRRLDEESESGAERSESGAEPTSKPGGKRKGDIVEGITSGATPAPASSQASMTELARRTALPQSPVQEQGAAAAYEEGMKS